MNRNLYQLVFKAHLGQFVPQPETAKRRGKTPGGVTLATVVLAAIACAPNAQAVMPVASAGGGNPAFVTYGNANYTVNGNMAVVSQVGTRSILNWQSFNISKGNTVQFRQVDSLASNNLVQGASFTSLNRIWDANPSLIAGSIQQGAGQQANITLVNSNGIAFMNGAQVNLNSFTATSLNLADKYVIGNLLGDSLNAQFQMDPAATPGFVAVMEGAQITAGSQGRVMLIAPTVVNKGTISAPDGQIILAAGAKAYLRSNDNNNYNLRGILVEVDSTAGLNNFTTANSTVPTALTLDGVTQQTNASESRLGQATNTGTLSTPRGNITMVGYSVNQNGIAKATTSVVSNGSIYLMGKDTSVATNNATSRDSSRGGQVILGSGSSTDVSIETADNTTTTDNVLTGGGTGLDRASEVRIIGSRVQLMEGASIVAPAGKVSIAATSNPLNFDSATSSLFSLSNTATPGVRVDIASGAEIDVSGLDAVAVSVARNTVQVQLRGDELKDSPANQVGPLRGQTVYVDIDQALANVQAGKSTLIAADSVQGYANQIQRTAAERATAGGSVTIQSEGSTVLESGSKINLSGGSIAYSGAFVNQTLLSANGLLTDVANAVAGVRYTGIPSNLTVNYSRWNRSETFTSGATTTRYESGYVQGKNAGSLSIQSQGTAVLQAGIVGHTTVGERQQASGVAASGATLIVGQDFGGNGSKDFKLNQSVAIRDGYSNPVTGVGLDGALSGSRPLELDASMIGSGGVSNLKVYTNGSLEVDAAMDAGQGGQIALTGSNVVIGANMAAASGTISVNAVANNYTNLGTLAATGMSLMVRDGVHLTTTGVWKNDKATVPSNSKLLPILDGGSISLSATSPSQNGSVILATGVKIDAGAGAYVSSSGKVNYGKGGSISLAGDALTGLDGNVSAFAAQNGGNLSLSATRIQIGGIADTTFGALNLNPFFFTQGGFSSYALTGFNSLELAAGTKIAPVQLNTQIKSGALLAPTGTAIAALADVYLRPDAVRGGTNLSLASGQSALGLGTLDIKAGADIEMAPGATVSLSARNALTVSGTVRSQGGAINLTLDESNGLAGVSASQNVLVLGTGSLLDASGVAKTYADANGGLNGTVLNGGRVSLTANTGYVIAEGGSAINISGAPAAILDVRNEAGGMGRSVGSDAGTLKIVAEEGLVLQSAVSAQTMAPGQRGGNIEISLSKNAVPNQSTGYDTDTREMHIAQSQTVPVTGTVNTAPATLLGTTRANLGWDTFSASGADNISFSSRDGIVFDGALNAASSGALPMRSLVFDAARIQTNGGTVNLAADTVSLGNASSARVGANATAVSSGILNVSARQIDLVGNIRLRGVDQVNLNATELVSLNGVTSASGSSYQSSATISVEANLNVISPLVTTSSDSAIDVKATGKTVTFKANAAPAYQPLSALGSLKVEALNIDQGGNIWLPFGSVDLEATGAAVLEAGSEISVAAQAGSTLPLGQTVNGNSWIVNLAPATVPAGQVPLAQLPVKAVTVNGATVNMKKGSVVNVAGGGDLQAYEFTVGPGGSTDMLANANTYAIVPGYQGGFAPADPQEAFGLRSGTAIYLTGVNGLANGTYTLLPAHYALLPGAFAVKLNTGISMAPGQTYIQQDGVTVASAYLTDSRAGAPKDANWQGVQVFTGAQIHARSELAVTDASTYFATSSSRPADAGSFSTSTRSSGASSLNLDGTFITTAAAGGNGTTMDISAPNLAIVSGATTGIDTTSFSVLDVATLNATGAESLLLGATRTAASGVTTLSVGAANVRLANDAAHPLEAGEIILAATNTVALDAGSSLVSQGVGVGTQSYTTSGMGSLVRVANNAATFVRTGTVGNTSGTLTGSTGSTLLSSNSILLDATKSNSFNGVVAFADAGHAVAGNLAIGGPRVNFGNAGANVAGITYSQTKLDALAQLGTMAFTSYSTFDFYGDVSLGGLDSAGVPTLGELALHGAGLAGMGTSANKVSIGANLLTIDNPSGASFVAGGVLGSDTLQVTAGTLNLGAGTKTLSGFSSTNISTKQLVGQSTGSTNVTGNLNLATARITGSKGSNQSLSGTANIAIGNDAGVSSLSPVSERGATWSISASRDLSLSTSVTLPSGNLSLSAGTGAVALGSDAYIDVSGRGNPLFDQASTSFAGNVSIVSASSNINIAAGAGINVSAAPGGDAGTLSLKASSGTVSVASGTLQGSAQADASGQVGQGAQFSLDVKTLNNFSTLNAAVNSGGFTGKRDLRVRNGNVVVASSDTVSAKSVTLSADNGSLDIYGTIESVADSGASIGLFSSDNLTVHAGAFLKATSTGSGKVGGSIELASVAGAIDLAGGNIDASGGPQGTGGTLNIRAARNGDGTDVNIVELKSIVTGVSRETIEAVQTYSGITTLLSNGTSQDSTLTLDTINSDNQSFGANNDAILARLEQSANPLVQVISGVEVRSPVNGALTLAEDWNLVGSRVGVAPGTLTLRSSGALNISANLSDAFSVATATDDAGNPATLVPGPSWGYRLIAGADYTAANPMATATTVKNIAIAAGSLIRTGTGDIKLAASGNIALGDASTAIYTAGDVNNASPNGFVSPPTLDGQNAGIPFAQFTKGGGNISLNAGGNIVGAASTQLFSEWLFREGELDPTGATLYATNGVAGSPAWWVRFDLFGQGVAALGGGDVAITAKGAVQNLSASSVTQGQVGFDANGPVLVKTGGGDVRVQAGQSILGGEYFADSGALHLVAGGAIDSGQIAAVSRKPVYTVLAASDGKVDVGALASVNIQTILNPTLLPQSRSTSPSLDSVSNISSSPGDGQVLRSAFSTYAPDTSVVLTSVNGNVNLMGAHGSTTVADMTGVYALLTGGKSTYDSSYASLLNYLPGSLTMDAVQGNVTLSKEAVGSSITLASSPTGQLNMLAQGSVNLNANLRMSDSDLALLANPLNPASNPKSFLTQDAIHAVVPVHIADDSTAHIYAESGNVAGVTTVTGVSDILTLPKAVDVRAGLDVLNLNASIANSGASQVSSIQAGRDITFTSAIGHRNDSDSIKIAGTGSLDVVAGRNLSLGTSGGIISVGNLENPNLPAQGADIHVAAGVGSGGIDYSGAVTRLLSELQAGNVTNATLWQARWLTGNSALTTSMATSAVQALLALSPTDLEQKVRSWVYTALLSTGRDYNNAGSPYAGDYSRGYAALELLFPGIEAKNPDGTYANYSGSLNMFASRIKSIGGGSIDFMVPGGDTVVGLANTPAVLVNVGSNVLGIVVGGAGNVDGFARNNITVNQSRILTVGGGDVLLWSSDAGIDAGKGKKTASAVPPPIISIDSQGNVTQTLQGAATGSGIGALAPASGMAGSVDLIAPKGTVNAGDAGIRAGNLNVAALDFKGADNVTVSGRSSGVPIADTSAVTAAASGATGMSDDASKTIAAASQAASEAARSAQQMASSFKPSIVNVDVLGYGE